MAKKECFRMHNKKKVKERRCSECTDVIDCMVYSIDANDESEKSNAVKLDTGKRKLSLNHPSTMCAILISPDAEREKIKDAIYHLSEAAHAESEVDFISCAYQAIADIVRFIGNELEALEQMAIAMEYGANKPEYGRNNWKKGMEWSRLVDAAQRHGIAILQGEDVDKDSGNLHVAHMLASVHMLLGNHALKVGVNDLY